MKTNRILTTYIVLLIAFALDALYQWKFGLYFTVGIVPIMVFGTVWNMISGIRLHEILGKPDQLNKAKFIILNIIGLLYWVITTILWNIYRHPPTPINEADIVDIAFPFLYGFVSIIALYIPVYSISFVTRALTMLNVGSRSRLSLTLAIIFFPIGLWWIESQIPRQIPR